MVKMHSRTYVGARCFIYIVSTIFFLYSTYYQYYQNITNDDIIKLYEKFKPDFLSFGYTLEGFVWKVNRMAQEGRRDTS